MTDPVDMAKPVQCSKVQKFKDGFSGVPAIARVQNVQLAERLREDERLQRQVKRVAEGCPE
jgi:hypothetical protein